MRLYTLDTGGELALTANVAKTLLALDAAADVLLAAVELSVAFDATDPAVEACRVELCRWDGAGAGTATSATPTQERGPAASFPGTGARNYTAEPTVLTPIRRWRPNITDAFVWRFPLEGEPHGLAGEGLALRVTAPVGVNAEAYLTVRPG